MSNLGRLAFEAFSESRLIQGHEHVEWEELPTDVRTAWDEVGVRLKSQLSFNSCPWCGFRQEKPPT